MLYRLDVMKDSTLDDLIAWLETKPAAETYVYTHGRKCGLCVFLQEHGIREPYVDSGFWSDSLLNRATQLPDRFDDVMAARGTNAEDRWTYGAALARAINIREWQKREA